MTYEEFLVSPDVPEHSEWVNGEVIKMMTVSDLHARTVAWLASILGPYVRHRGLGELLLEPFNMKCNAELPGRAPDLMVVLEAHRHRVARLHLDGPADVVIDVISPGTESTDRGEKFYEYEAGGVTEYWMIDPQRETVDFLVRSADGYFRPVSPFDGVYTSPQLPGLALAIDWLWELPDPFDTLATLLGR